MLTEISYFFGPYRFLSNFYQHPQFTEGIWWPTNEHYYQYKKATSEQDYWKERILEKLDPKWAKHIGCYKIPIPANWDQIKDDVMMAGLRSKFKDPFLANLLMDTDPLPLIEGNHWGDTYWGMCKGRGLNRLGEMLMQIRTDLILM